MYIPNHQYEVITALDLTHSELFYEDGTPFTKNSFVRLSNGLRYDVPEADLKKGLFNRAKKIVSNEDNVGPELFLDFLKPFIPIRILGKAKIKRFFIKHKVTTQILEVDSDKYSEFFTNEPSHLAFGSMDWHIVGPLYDINNSNYLQEGTVTKNARELDNLEKKLLGIKSYVRDLTYLSDPQYADQRPQISQTRNIVLSSPS